MTPESVLLNAKWEDVSTPRMGVAQLTRMAFEGADLRPLWHSLMKRATDDRAGAGMGMDLSVIAQLLGDQKTGLSIQDDTLAFEQLYRSPCAAATPRLRVLAFAAAMDIGGNTPLEFLLKDSDIELVTFYVVPGRPLPNPMPDHDVAIVIAPDSRDAQGALAVVEGLAPRWPRPMLNLPAHILRLGRDRLHNVLSRITGLEIPATVRADRGVLMAVAASERSLCDILGDGKFPIIIRPTESHAGFGLAKIDNRGALLPYLSQRTEDAFFISRYVDYASADGNFRKYRLVVVDGKPYACHMAIAEEWKVWYLNADMAVSVPNRTEEAMFMHAFDTDFGRRHGKALSELIARIGLDYFIIDCAETRSGDLLIFEADNSAIVHDMDPPSVYPYKPAQMRKIFEAVQTMFRRHAKATGRTMESAA